MNLKKIIAGNPGIKTTVHKLLVSKGSRPRWLTRWFVNPFVHEKSTHARISSKARLDVLPNHRFKIGKGSTIEDHCIISNGVGDVFIGENTFIGYSNIIIGPVSMGNNIIFAQHITVSGLNHQYEDPETPIQYQPCTTKEIIIEDDCWIGANAVITAGTRIGKHSVVAAGSVVTKNVPPFSVVGGNPARVLKQYNPTTKTWERPI